MPLLDLVLVVATEEVLLARFGEHSGDLQLIAGPKALQLIRCAPIAVSRDLQGVDGHDMARVDPALFEW